MTASHAGTAAPLVEADDLAVHYAGRGGWLRPATPDVRAVDGVTISIRRGETLGLVGESGCGKSTLGRALLALRRPTAGTIRFDGRELASLPPGELRRLRQRMQMIFQDPYGSLDPRMKVGRTVGEPLRVHGLSRGAQLRQRVHELLRLVGLEPAYADRYPHEFSGGQRQRIGIARALAVDPDFVVCDEPISALDVSIQAQVLNLLVRLRSELGLTYLFIAHDLSVVRHISDRVGVMYLGKLVELGPPGAIYAGAAHPYTRSLLSAVPLPDPRAERGRRRVILTGDMPSPASPPPGCRFHTRCWLYERLGQPSACRTEDPALRPAGSDHEAACHFTDESITSGVGVVRPGTAPERGRRRRAPALETRPEDPS